MNKFYINQNCVIKKGRDSIAVWMFRINLTTLSIFRS